MFSTFAGMVKLSHRQSKKAGQMDFEDKLAIDSHNFIA